MNALIIIDVQRGMFAGPALQPHDGDGTVGRIAGLLNAARATGHKVIFVQHDGGPGDPLDANGPGFAFHKALAPAPGEPVFTKTHCSAFQGTRLSECLDQAGIKSLTVCGMQTEFCVDTTCRDAVERGFGLTLVSDGHTSFDSPEMTAEAIIRHHNSVLAMGFAARLETADSVEKSFGF